MTHSHLHLHNITLITSLKDLCSNHPNNSTNPLAEMNNFSWLFILSVIPPYTFLFFLLNTFFHRPQSLTISSLNHSTPNHILFHPLGLFKCLRTLPISRLMVPFLETLATYSSQRASSSPTFPSALTLQWCMFLSDVKVLFSWVWSTSSLKWLLLQVWGSDRCRLMWPFAVWMTYFPAEHVIYGIFSNHLSPK